MSALGCAATLLGWHGSHYLLCPAPGLLAQRGGASCGRSAPYQKQYGSWRSGCRTQLPRRSCRHERDGQCFRPESGWSAAHSGRRPRPLIRIQLDQRLQRIQGLIEVIGWTFTSDGRESKVVQTLQGRRGPNAVSLHPDDLGLRQAVDRPVQPLPAGCWPHVAYSSSRVTGWV